MKRICVAVLVVLVLGGCAVASAPEEVRAPLPDSAYAGLSARQETAKAQQPPTDGPPVQGPGKVEEAPLEPAELRIQRAGVITLAVKHELKFALELLKHAGKFDALVMAFSNTEVTWRMPSARINALLEWLAGQDPKLVEIDAFDFSALDRTAEFYSLEGRIEAARSAYNRTLELLKAAPNSHELGQLEARLEQLQKKLDGFETTLRDIKLNAGRVELKLRIK
ncbi:MAG: DUF4349 domain-containing protein [Planctomycetes bacterium]|jgi:hypothetical protein|nr:DUF4349 domain-containing protein [Planctomycetota bacterium]MCL4730097.1 DUF4349 domain-containing protein [Planctomycetota bacterium]